MRFLVLMLPFWIQGDIAMEEMRVTITLRKLAYLNDISPFLIEDTLILV
jgi:hypothetical protein